jgi:hypothetical protein
VSEWASSKSGGILSFHQCKTLWAKTINTKSLSTWAPNVSDSQDNHNQPGPRDVVSAHRHHHGSDRCSLVPILWLRDQMLRGPRWPTLSSITMSHSLHSEAVRTQHLGLCHPLCIILGLVQAPLYPASALTVVPAARLIGPCWCDNLLQLTQQQ